MQIGYTRNKESVIPATNIDAFQETTPEDAIKEGNITMTSPACFLHLRFPLTVFSILTIIIPEFPNVSS